jgi:hypothetical protein
MVTETPGGDSSAGDTKPEGTTFAFADAIVGDAFTFGGDAAGFAALPRNTCDAAVPGEFPAPMALRLGSSGMFDDNTELFSVVAAAS